MAVIARFLVSLLLALGEGAFWCIGPGDIFWRSYLHLRWQHFKCSSSHRGIGAWEHSKNMGTKHTSVNRE